MITELHSRLCLIFIRLHLGLQHDLGIISLSLLEGFNISQGTVPESKNTKAIIWTSEELLSIGILVTQLNEIWN